MSAEATISCSRLIAHGTNLAGRLLIKSICIKVEGTFRRRKAPLCEKQGHIDMKDLT